MVFFGPKTVLSGRMSAAFRPNDRRFQSNTTQQVPGALVA